MFLCIADINVQFNVLFTKKAKIDNYLETGNNDDNILTENN